MRQSKIFIGIFFSVGLIAIVGVIFWRQYTALPEIPGESAIHSPYAGQELRGI